MGAGDPLERALLHTYATTPAVVDDDESDERARPAGAGVHAASKQPRHEASLSLKPTHRPNPQHTSQAHSKAWSGVASLSPWPRRRPDPVREARLEETAAAQGERLSSLLERASRARLASHAFLACGTGLRHAASASTPQSHTQTASLRAS